MKDTYAPSYVPMVTSILDLCVPACFRRCRVPSPLGRVNLDRIVRGRLHLPHQLWLLLFHFWGGNTDGNLSDTFVGIIPKSVTVHRRLGCPLLVDCS